MVHRKPLAVQNEGYPHPRRWDELLAERVPKGDVFNLETINGGFIRPSSSDDWAMAYCQAELYAQYTLDHFGQDALAKMLAAYADNLNTRATIRQALGVDQAEFERGYAAYLNRIVEGLSGLAPSTAIDTAELENLHAAKPNDLEISSRLAMSLLNQGETKKAKSLADAVRQKEPKQPLASYVEARLALVAGEKAKAIEILKNALDQNAPQENVLALLAGLESEIDSPAAEELYRLGARKFPQDDQWSKALARIYLQRGEDDKLVDVLGGLADRDPDNIAMRKKLAQLALKAKHFDLAEHWATEALYIDVQDVETHRMLAESLVGRKEYESAVSEYETAIELEPKSRQLQFALAEACLRTGRKRRARDLIKAILAAEPDFPGAAELLQQTEEQAKP